MAAVACQASWGLLLLLFNFPLSWVPSFSLVRIWRTFAAHCRDLSKICMGAAELFEHRESLKMSWPWTKRFALVIIEGRRAACYFLPDSTPTEVRTLTSPQISWLLSSLLQYVCRLVQNQFVCLFQVWGLSFNWRKFYKIFSADVC